MNKMCNGGQMCEAHLHGYCVTLNQNELLLSTFRYGSRHETDQDMPPHYLSPYDMTPSFKEFIGEQQLET